MRKWTVAVIIAVSPAVGMACSPPVDKTPLQQQVLRAFCAADVVFIGRVNEQRQLGQHAVEHELRPIWAFKGLDVRRNARPKFVLTAGDSCDISFTKRRSYLIFGRLDAESERVVPGGFSGPLERVDAIRMYLEEIADVTDICSVAGAPAVPHHLLPLQWRRDLLEQLREEPASAE